DWSWAPLLADFDLDGRQDLIISNGYGKDITDLDYINYTNNLGPFMTPEEKKKLRMDGLNILKEVKLNNYAYRNKGNFTFEDVSASWGIDGLGISNGMAYADLDGDGDLDLVTNNLNETAGIYRNGRVDISGNDSSANWIKIKLVGKASNPLAIGAEIRGFIHDKGEVQTLSKSLHPTRGYKSAMFEDVTFGLGARGVLDSIWVIWPDGSRSTVGQAAGNKTLTVSQEETSLDIYEKQVDEPRAYADVSNTFENN